jgi:hypothetical protein
MPLKNVPEALPEKETILFNIEGVVNVKILQILQILQKFRSIYLYF